METKIFEEKNKYASIYRGIGIFILVVGFFAGVMVASDTNELGSLLAMWGSSALVALGAFAIGEIIQILHDIRKKVYSKK